MPHSEPTIWQLMYGFAATLLGLLTYQWRRMHQKVDRLDRECPTRRELHEYHKQFSESNDQAHNELKKGIGEVHKRVDEIYKHLSDK